MSIPFSKYDQKGFTLVELLVVMGAAGILMAVVMTTFNVLNKNLSGENVRVAMQQGLRSAVNVIAFDIKQASLDPFRSGDFRIMKAKSDDLEFSSDINVNGKFEADERFRYYFNPQDKTLCFQNNGTPQPMLSNIDTFKLTFFDSNGTILNSGTGLVQSPERIRTVEIFVSASEKYWGGSSVEKKEYRTSVRCRNKGEI